jgi:hypothetical protein
MFDWPLICTLLRLAEIVARRLAETASRLAGTEGTTASCTPFKERTEGTTASPAKSGFKRETLLSFMH